MKNNIFSDQFDAYDLEQIEHKQDLRRKRFVQRMERKLWLKQHGYGRHTTKSRRPRQEHTFRYYSGTGRVV